VHADDTFYWPNPMQFEAMARSASQIRVGNQRTHNGHMDMPRCCFYALYGHVQSALECLQ